MKIKEYTGDRLWLSREQKTGDAGSGDEGV